MFSSEIYKNFRNTYFEEHPWMNVLRILQEELLNSASKFLHFNVYILFKFSGQIQAWYTSRNHEQCIFIVYDSSGRERNKQFSTSIKINWTKIHFYNLILFICFYKYSHPKADKCMLKFISDYIKDIKIYINLASCSSWNHCFECKLAVEVFSFPMLLAWIIHQIVDIFFKAFSIYDGFKMSFYLIENVSR